MLLFHSDELKIEFDPFFCGFSFVCIFLLESLKEFYGNDVCSFIHNYHLELVASVNNHLAHKIHNSNKICKCVCIFDFKCLKKYLLPFIRRFCANSSWSALSITRIQQFKKPIAVFSTYTHLRKQKMLRKFWKKAFLSVQIVNEIALHFLFVCCLKLFPRMGTWRIQTETILCATSFCIDFTISVDTLSIAFIRNYWLRWVSGYGMVWCVSISLNYINLEVIEVQQISSEPKVPFLFIYIFLYLKL